MGKTATVVKAAKLFTERKTTTVPNTQKSNNKHVLIVAPTDDALDPG